MKELTNQQKIEAIQERMEVMYDNKTYYYNDIAYLLQRLEIAQKALEGVVNVIHVQGENRDIGEQSQWDEALLFKVREALDQLKE